MPLSIVIWLPAAVALVAAFLPARLAPRVVFCGALVALGIAVGYVVGFDRGTDGLQHVTDRAWISQLGIHYKLGLDGLNLILVLVTTILFSAGLLAANLRDWERPRLFYFMFALAESGVLGAFCAQDLALFVAFFDLMLIPFYFLIGAWGERDRVRATTKLVIYTLVGSLFMLAAAIATGVIAARGNAPLSFALSDLAQQQLPEGSQNWIFLCFAFAFLVKMPLFPFHGWMPDGYRAMPLPVLAVFSAVLSKVAAYGFLRVVLPLYPDASVHFQTLMLLIALVAILYGSMVALSQTDARLIVGFSSVAQLGFIVLGIFSLRPEGAQGALLQMANHALVVVPLFLIIGALAVRAGGSEDIRDMGGIAFRAPVLAALFLVVAFANLAMPGSSNFVGEFYILLGVFKAKLVFSLIAATGVILASVYTLRIFIRAVHGRVTDGVQSRELGLFELAPLAPVVVVIVALGVYPQLPLSRSERSVKASVRTAQQIANPPPAREAAAAAPPGGSSQIPVGEGDPGEAEREREEQQQEGAP
jgi:NADH-quinone oxidoreductase subunit M